MKAPVSFAVTPFPKVPRIMLSPFFLATNILQYPPKVVSGMWTGIEGSLRSFSKGSREPVSGDNT
jgi:hypothetical protein